MVSKGYPLDAEIAKLTVSSLYEGHRTTDLTRDRQPRDIRNEYLP